jgi:hypothetical protein
MPSSSSLIAAPEAGPGCSESTRKAASGPSSQRKKTPRRCCPRWGSRKSAGLMV